MAALAVALVASSCTRPRAYGPVKSAEDAQAAARVLTDLSPPIELLGEVAHGRAGDLYRGALASPGDANQAREFAARAQRSAWSVELTGYATKNCASPPTCPLVRWRQQLVIDEFDGTLLYSTTAVVP
jgi:outer membrane biogenesis lipoprotein LolB